MKKIISLKEKRSKMELQPLDYLNGILSLMLIVQSLYTATLISSRYFKYKDRTYILLGITTILLYASWWPSMISFLLILFTGQGLSLQMYILIGNVFVPVSIVIWLAIITHFLYPNQQKIVVIVSSIIGIIFEIFFFYFLFTTPELMGELQGAVDIQYTNFVVVYLLAIILIILITGLKFALTTMKIDDPELKIKGKFMLIGFISFVFGAILDSAIPLNLITLLLTRIILMLAAIELYIGFVLPDWAKNIFLKNKRE